MLSLSRSKPFWDAFLNEIKRLDNEEPRASAGANFPYKNASLAMEAKEVRGGSPSKEELAQEVSELKKRLADRGSASKGAPKASFTPGQNTKRDMKCYNCRKKGHMARECRGGRKQRDGPNTTEGQKRARQAEGQGKDQQN